MTDTTPHYYDDTFYIEETRWKTWRPYNKEGKELVTSLSKEICIDATRFYLKGTQDGWDSLSCSTYEGEVGGKL